MRRCRKFHKEPRLLAGADVMDRHKRMARTLGCLVASMTVGAAILDAVQPSRAGAARQSIELTARGSSLDQSWSAIRIAPQWAVGRSHLGETHFIIDPDGKCSPTDHWLKQRRFRQEPVVRIYLLAPAQSNYVTVAQWTTTQELVAALQQRCQIPDQRVLRDDTLAVPAVASNETFRHSRP